MKWGMDLDRIESPNNRNIYEYNISGKLVSHRPLNTVDIFGAPWCSTIASRCTRSFSTLPPRPTLLSQVSLPSSTSAARVVDIDGEAGVITLADGTTFQGDVVVAEEMASRACCRTMSWVGLPMPSRAVTRPTVC